MLLTHEVKSRLIHRSLAPSPPHFCLFIPLQGRRKKKDQKKKVKENKRRGNWFYKAQGVLNSHSWLHGLEYFRLLYISCDKKEAKQGLLF